MPATCRFLFSDDDAERIIPTELQVADLPLSDPWPQGMRLRFKTTQNARVMVRPLTQCNMRFVVDPNAPGILPTPDKVILTPESTRDANYNTWKVVGMLVLELMIASKTLRTLAPTLLVKPNRIWLGPVTISKDFLFDSLIKKGKLPRDPVDTLKPTDDPAKELEWQQHAISQFLAGVYDPTVTFNDALRVDMPLIGFNAADGIHELKIFAANAAKPEDAEDEEWDPGQSEEARDEARLLPAHPRNGVIPARLVYQELRTHMVPAATDAAKAIRDLVVEPAPAPAPRAFFPIRFTRTWNPPAAHPYDTSIYFPQQEVVFRNPALAELRRQRLPAHGILWVDGHFFTNFSLGTTIELEGGMRWLPWSADVWRRKGELTPVPMSTGPDVQHIVVRLPMSKAMLEDDSRPRGDSETACTYFSMRRSVRAWIDNRIAGGRLSKEVNEKVDHRGDVGKVTTPSETRALFANTGIGASRVSNNSPSTSMSAADGVRELTPILITLFSDDCVQHPIPDTEPPPDAEIWPQGRAAAYLWQSAQETMKDAKLVRNFSDDHIGRGGPGAIVMLGLAEYHCDELPPEDSSEDTQYMDEIVGIMTNGGLNPGATTQLWRNINFYRGMLDRTTEVPTPPGPLGHSPVFARYIRNTGGSITGMRIIDQGREDTYGVLGTPPNRQFVDGLVWIAANWTE